MQNPLLELEQKASLCYLLTSCSSDFVEFLNRLFTPPLAILGPFNRGEEEGEASSPRGFPRAEKEQEARLAVAHFGEISSTRTGAARARFRNLDAKRDLRGGGEAL